MTTHRILLVLLVLVGIVGIIDRYRRKGIKGLMALWLPILLIVIVAYSILGWSLFFMQSSFLYRPVGPVLYDPSDVGLEFEKVHLETADSIKLVAWFTPAKDATITVLLCHGNGGNISHRLDTINLLNELGLNSLVFDYRGYGQSKGKTTEEGTYLDARAAWGWLVETKKTDPKNIILFGRSLGGSVAAKLATDVEARGLVLESSFTSFIDIGKKFYPYMPVKLFARFKYNTLQYLQQTDCPVLIVHSRGDEMIPFELGLRLYDAASEPKEFLEISGGHNEGFLSSGETYKQGWLTWLKFLEEYKKTAEPNLKIS